LRRGAHFAFLYSTSSQSVAVRSTSDLSLKMFVALRAGLVLWIVYGLLRSDWGIIAANSVGASLSASLLAFKIRDLRSDSD
jgi:uncharacterized protein with PQ loop repeat